MTIPAAAIGPLITGAAKLIGELIKMIADATGETTEQVRGRVLRELASGSADATDSVATEIDSHLPEAGR